MDSQATVVAEDVQVAAKPRAAGRWHWSRRLKDSAIETELKSVLSAAIDELPLDYRTAFVLHDVEGLPNPEIA